MQHATLSARKTQTKKAVVGSAPALTVEKDQPAPQGPKAAKAAYCSLRLKMQNAHLDLKSQYGGVWVYAGARLALGLAQFCGNPSLQILGRPGGSIRKRTVHGWSMDTAQRLARLAGVARFRRFLISGRPAQPEGNEAFRLLPCRCAGQIEQALELQRSEVQAPSKRKDPGWRVGLLGGLLLAD